MRFENTPLLCDRRTSSGKRVRGATHTHTHTHTHFPYPNWGSPGAARGARGSSVPTKANRLCTRRLGVTLVEGKKGKTAEPLPWVRR